MPIATLEQLAQLVQSSLSESEFFFINTRVLLRTGVNLRQLSSDHIGSKDHLEAVRLVLVEMSINLTEPQQ